MSRERIPQDESEILNSLYKFVEEDLNETESFSLDDIKDELENEGVNVERVIAIVEQKIARMKAQRILADARDQRHEHLRRIPDQIKNLVDATVQRKQEIISQIKQEISGSQDEVLAYCRKLEGISAKDVETLLADLKLLDRLDGGADEDRQD